MFLAGLNVYKIVYMMGCSFLALMIGSSAQAMEKAFAKDNICAVDELIPAEVIALILQELTLDDLPVSFISKKWKRAAEIRFPKFYKFLKNYHECTARFGKDINQKSAFNMLKSLRKAELSLHDLSKQEKTSLAEAFLYHNFESINAMLVTHKSMRNIEFKKYPKRLVQMSLLRIWDNLPDINKSLEDYDHPYLKMLAPADALKTFFSNEPDFATKCDLASELCERGNYDQTVIREANKFLQQGLYDEYVELFKIKLNKNPNLGAALAYFNLENWQRAAELYESALSKDPEQSAFDYANAGRAHLMLGNWHRATELYDIALNKDPNLAEFNHVNAAFAHLNL